MLEEGHEHKDMDMDSILLGMASGSAMGLQSSSMDIGTSFLSLFRLKLILVGAL